MLDALRILAATKIIINISVKTIIKGFRNAVDIPSKRFGFAVCFIYITLVYFVVWPN
ncbi:MAG TPA: hypothetical protein VMZ91_12765 [Candidatus Paceibacterota bacterium]|nr:hypothetical protein [Candidatus Paceibacterota bacterium]